jgi:hypothetical protein
MLLSVYFTAAIFVAKMYQFETEDPSSNLLPRLINESQRTDSAEKRVEGAQYAYKLYGVKLTYIDPSGKFATYTPTPQDAAYFANEKKMAAQKQASLTQLKAALDQYPYLFSFYLGAFFLTFLVGPLFFAFRRTDPAPALQH